LSGECKDLQAAGRRRPPTSSGWCRRHQPWSVTVAIQAYTRPNR
jgi:hypothetical protein